MNEGFKSDNREIESNNLELSENGIPLVLNKEGEKVAIKCKYKKEGITRKAIENSGKYFDAYLYAKTK